MLIKNGNNEEYSELSEILDMEFGGNKIPIPHMNEFQESDIIYFFDALRGNVVYGANDYRINHVENFLVYWLRGWWFKNKYTIIQWMFEHGITDYVYEGEAYRGIILRSGRYIEYGHYASFTLDENVACNFGIIEGNDYSDYTRYVFRVHGTFFNLLSLLHDVSRLTDNWALLSEVEICAYEKEKIGYFDENCVDVSNEFGLRG